MFQRIMQGIPLSSGLTASVGLRVRNEGVDFRFRVGVLETGV